MCVACRRSLFRQQGSATRRDSEAEWACAGHEIAYVAASQAMENQGKMQAIQTDSRYLSLAAVSTARSRDRGGRCPAYEIPALAVVRNGADVSASVSVFGYDRKACPDVRKSLENRRNGTSQILPNILASDRRDARLALVHGSPKREYTQYFRIQGVKAHS